VQTWPTTAERLIAIAMEDRGLGENPPGSNRNKITSWYGLTGAWCAMSLAYWMHKASGVDVRKALDCPGWALTTSAVAAARDAGIWHPGDSGIRRGDMVFYKLAGGDAGFVNHCGIVTMASDKQTIRSIEGNTSNVVAERTRARGYIVGYIRPPYGTIPKPTRSAPPFPGRRYFQLGATNGHVIQADKQLVRLGYTRHNDGHNGYNPGPRYTEYTRANVRDFQRAQHWTGEDADGLIGPETWRRLFTLPTPK
jgi:hypothetical protein